MTDPASLKLLWLCSDLESTNGWGSYARGLGEALIARGVRLRILTARHHPDTLDGAEVIPCLTSPLAPLDQPLAQAWNAAQIVQRQWGAQLVHAVVEPYAMSVATSPGLVMTLHGTYAVAPFREGPLTRWSFSRALRNAKRVVCVSNYTKGRLLEKVDVGNVAVIPNGARLPLDAEISRQTAPVPLLLGVGAVKRRKGYHVAIEAVAQLRAEFPSIKYVIVGDLSDHRYLAGLKLQIADLGLQDHVELAGTVDDARLRELYRAAWVFVLTPVNSGVAFEGFGLTYLEAGAYGLPVIGSLGCGAEDAILDGETGFLVPQESPTELAARLRALLLDPVLARSLGARGREHTRMFGWERVAESYLDVYLSALAR